MSQVDTPEGSSSFAPSTLFHVCVRGSQVVVRWRGENKNKKKKKKKRGKSRERERERERETGGDVVARNKRAENTGKKEQREAQYGEEAVGLLCPHSPSFSLSLIRSSHR